MILVCKVANSGSYETFETVSSACNHIIKNSSGLIEFENTKKSIPEIEILLNEVQTNQKSGELYGLEVKYKGEKWVLLEIIS